MVSSGVGFVILVLTLGLFAWVGFRARGRQSLEEYVVARGSQGGGVLGLSFLASGMGAWILFAPPEVGAFVGLVGVVGYALGAAAPILVIAPLGRRIRAVAPGGHSLTEFVRLRFGRGLSLYVVVLSILYMAVFLTAELTAVGAVTAILSGADPRVAVVLVGAVTIAYTAYGGLRASLRTDRWQAWLVLGLLAVVGFGVVNATDAPGAAIRGSGLLGVDRVGVEVAVTLVIAVLAANLFHQGYWQRVWAARGDEALGRGALLGGVATVPVVLVVGLLGVLAAGAGIGLGDPPAPVFALLGAAPSWAAALALALGVCLVASSADTLENALAGLIVVERPRFSLTGARLLTVALLVPAMVVAVQGHSVLRLFLIADLLCATAVVPVLLGLWARATSSGAFAGALAGIAGAIVPGWWTSGSLVEGVRLATFPDAIPTLAPFLGAVLASTAVALAVSLAQRRSADLAAVGAGVRPLGGADRDDDGGGDSYGDGGVTPDGG